MSELATALKRITYAVEEHGTEMVYVRYADLLVLVREIARLQDKLCAAYRLTDEEFLEYLLLGEPVVHSHKV